MQSAEMEIQTIYMLAMIGATGACILGVFYVCAACIRDETTLHDIKVEARKMRMEFDRRVTARNAGNHADSADGEEIDTNSDDDEVFMTI